MNRRVKRTLCTGLAALMLAGCMTGTTVYAETAKEKVDRLEAALKQEKASLEKLQKDKKNAEATKTKLQNQSALLKEQMAALLETITDAEEAVGNKENEIAQKQEEIDSRWDDFKQQMGAMQMMHDTGAVAMLASCDSLYELLTFSNTMQEVSEWNTQVLDEMKAQRETLNEEKAELEAAKEELENRKAQLETKSGQLAANIQATDATITKAEADAKAQQEVVSMAQAEYDRAEAEWEAFVRQQAQQAQGGSSDFTSDMFIWPLPGYSTITTYFGETQNINGLIKAGHKGIDVKVYIGDTIVSAFDGKVRIVKYEAGGYGKYIVVRHNNGLETIYGHLSKQLVKVGDEVRAGEPIGLGGNTGRSTGSHLHFETRLLGEAINPALLFDFVNQDVTCDFYDFINPHFRPSRLSDGASLAANTEQGNAEQGEPLLAQHDAEQPQARTASSSGRSNKGKVYKVKKGDSLYTISKRTGVSIRELCRRNNISKRAKLQLGQILRY